MINQQMTDMEFDTYFNVTSNTMQPSQQKQQQKPQPQPRQKQQKMMYNNNQHPLPQQQEAHPTQQLNMSQFNPQHYYLSKSSKQQSSTEMMNWSFNQQGTTSLHMQNNHNTVPTHVSFANTQASRPDYLYSTGQANSASTTPSELLLSQPSPQRLQYRANNNNEDQLRYGYRHSMDYQLPNQPVNKTTGLITPESDTTVSPRSPHALPSNSNSPSSTKRPTYDDSSNIMDAATVLASVGAGRQFKKVAHNAIERRYRKNINERILDLKNVVPALYKAKVGDNKSSGNEESSEDEYNGLEKRNSSTAEEIVEGVPVAKKLNKATILHKATEYIHHLKHSNQVAENENQALLHILGQMPGGLKVLDQFQVQKNEAEKAEQQRLIAQRKESIEQERVEHQRMLRERAAHRAALAELIPKPERKPYPRRAKKKQAVKSNDKGLQQKDDIRNDSFSPISQTNHTNKTFMVMFLCLAIISPLTFENPPDHNIRANPILKSRDIVFSDVSIPW
ncbi:hypothetical protein INT48_003939 [Thamnidium elegans]|uniref:BHLH domain-containing protein n=1 Tax=Thamnidium elegans TaxID=101142 RepID=A0A8H7SX00_9FUNG|nr:hypothetical protein INT48_003939 [Thamnidium elegans]